MIKESRTTNEIESSTPDNCSIEELKQKILSLSPDRRSWLLEEILKLD